MNRQNSINAIQSNRDSGPSCFTFLLLPVAIAAVVVAHEYDNYKLTSACRWPKGYARGERYVVEPQLFCYVAGYTQIGFCALVCLAQSCSLFASDNRGTILNVVNCPSVLLFFFYLVWGAIGLYMYDQQMTEMCRNEDMGQVIAAWGIYQYLMLSVGFIVISCFICCAGAVGLTYAAVNADDI